MEEKDRTSEAEGAEGVFDRYATPQERDILTGVIVAVTQDGVVVDLGLEREAVVPPSDLQGLEQEEREALRPGDEISVLVLNTQSPDKLIVSISLVQFEQDWIRAEELRKSREVIEAEVIGYNKGGAIIAFGRLRGFIPLTHLTAISLDMSERDQQQRLADLRGKTLALNVIEVNRPRRRLILAQREATATTEMANLLAQVGSKSVLPRLSKSGAWLERSHQRAEDLLRLMLEGSRAQPLTVAYLTETVMPYINALITIQQVIDEIKGNESSDVEILAIRQGSIAIDLTGGIRDTVQLVLDLIVPWRRENQKQLAQLDVAVKENELKQKEAEVERARATLDADTEKATADAHKAQAEADLLRQQERQLALANKKAELELFDLTLAMVDKIKPGLTDSERLYYATRFLDPTRLIATSPLELAGVEVINTDNPTEEEE